MLSLTEKETQAEGFLMSIINSIADPIFVKDDKHRWVLLNNAICDFVGHTREDLLGKSDYDFFPKEQADVFWQKDEDVLKSGKININEETITDAAGNIRVIVTKKSVYINSLGQKYIVGIIRDVTEMKQVEIESRKHTEDLEKLNRIMAGREQKMIELQNELEQLRQKLEKCEKSVLS